MSQKSLSVLSQTPASLPPLHRANRGLVIARVYYFCFFGAIGAIIPFFNIFLESRGLTGVQIGWLGSIPPLLALVAGPFWSGIADRWQVHRAVLTLCVVVAGLASVLFIWTDSLIALLFLIVVLYFFRAPVPALLDSTVIEMTQTMGVAYGRQRVWGSIGFILATYGLGRLVNNGSLDWVFWIHGMLLAGACGILSLLLPLVKRGGQIDMRSGLRTLLDHAPVRTFLIACVLLGIGAAGLMNFMGLYMLQLGGSQAQVGLAFAVNAVIEVPIMFVGAAWLARYGNERLVVFGSAGYAVAWTLMAFAQTPMQLICAVALVGVGYGVFWIAAVGYVDEQAPPGLGATAQAIMGAAMFGLGWSLGSLIAGLLWEWSNGHILYLVMGAFGVAATLLLYFGRRQEIRAAGA